MPVSLEKELLLKQLEALSSEDYFLSAIRILGQSLQADRCFLIEVENGEAKPIRYEYNSSTEVKPFLNFVPPWGECPFLQKCESLQNVVVDDVSALNPPLADSWLQFFLSNQIRGFIGIPLHISPEASYTLVLQTTEPRAWTTAEKEYLAAFANHFKDFMAR